MNRWMNDPQHLAQIGHFFGAYAIVVTTALLSFSLGRGWDPILVAIAILVVAAAIKEFWYDMRYELPKQSWGDSEMDFAFYLFGAAAGSATVMLAFRLAARA